ncbi:hypothetical protein [Brenneria goodwinii]|uniref:hypothetical protein n=1 Tax=Brenneria goodwinii TaxID=1109412 RepID=UPI0036EF4FC5
MLDWTEFTSALGMTEMSKEFSQLSLSIGEKPQISDDPAEYNDPLGHTKHYKYIRSGLEIGFRQNLLNHVHFYFDGYEGYSIFKGQLLSGVSFGWSEEAVVQVLGEPTVGGGGKVDMLLGYINRWVKYEKEAYALHMQFNQNNQLCRASLITIR